MGWYNGIYVCIYIYNVTVIIIAIRMRPLNIYGTDAYIWYNVHMCSIWQEYNWMYISRLVTTSNMGYSGSHGIR